MHALGGPVGGARHISLWKGKRNRPRPSRDSRFNPTPRSGMPEGFHIDQPRTSLGFKVISGLTRQLQGSLKVFSNEPKGVRFLLDLPILPKDR